MPTYTPGDSIFDLLQVHIPPKQFITAQTLRPQHASTAIPRMKIASDAQEYRIQRSYIEMDKENQLVALEQICYEMPSTGILGEKGIFMGKSECELSDMGDKLQNLIDEVWWSNEKKHDEN